MSRIIITGGNRGIGKQIAKDLATQGHEVILTARNPEKGRQAADEAGATFRQLDVSDPASISSFASTYATQYDSLDVLINNAGIFQDKNKQAHNPDFDVIRKTIETNLLGAWQLTVAMLPMLRKSGDARVINMSSGLGAIKEMGGQYPGYRLSKVGMNAMTRMIYAELGDQIKINAICPGWVKTDMGGEGAHRSLAQGAETAVWLATNPEIPNGKFLRDKEVIEW